MPPPSVLHITPSFAPSIGGLETFVQGLAVNLRRSGVHTGVLHLSPAIRSAGFHEHEGMPVWSLPLFPHRLLGIAPGLRRIASQFDILHVHDPQLMALTANCLLQSPRQPKLLSTHGGFFHTSQYSLAKKLHWRFLAAPLLRQYQTVIAGSSSDLTLFQSKASHVRLIPPAVDVSQFLTAPSLHPPDPTRWLYWGRLAKNKRIDTLISTVQQACALNFNVHLTIAGEDTDRLSPALLRQIRTKRLDPNINLVGPLSHQALLQEIGRCSVFITASEYEGFGLTVLEAMAAGLVIVCRDTAPLNSFVSHQQNGFLLTFTGLPSDAATLQAICSATPRQIAEIQQNARSTARSFNWESAIVQYRLAYVDIGQRSNRR